MVGNAGEEAAFYRLLALSLTGNSTLPEDSTANLIGCGSRTLARSRVDNAVPAWRYVYEAEWPNTDIGFPGAWHGSEISMAFGANEFMSRRQSTAEQKRLSFAMRTAWTGFAKEPYLALRELGWPVYDDDGKFTFEIWWCGFTWRLKNWTRLANMFSYILAATVIVLGGPNSSAIEFERKDRFLEGCPPSRYDIV